MIIPGQVPCLCRCITDLSSFSPTRTFQTRTFPHQLVASDSQTHLVFIARTNNRATHSSGFHTPDCRGSRGSSRNSCPGSTLLRYHVCGVSALCTVLSDHVGHRQPPLSGTGVLWGVNRDPPVCVDPPRQGGGKTMRQPSGCCTAAALH